MAAPYSSCSGIARVTSALAALVITGALFGWVAFGLTGVDEGAQVAVVPAAAPAGAALA